MRACHILMSILLVHGLYRLMKNIIKYSFSIIMVAAGIAIWAFHNGSSKGTSVLPPMEGGNIENDVMYSGVINEVVDLGLFQDRVNDLKAVNPEQEKILPIVILTTKSCPPCLNNVAEFADLLIKNERFYNPLLLVWNENETTVQRFLAVSSLELPFEVAKKDEHQSFLKELEQNLVFIDWETSIAFYNYPIPNFTSSTQHNAVLLYEVSQIHRKHHVEKIYKPSYDVDITKNEPKLSLNTEM